LGPTQAGRALKGSGALKKPLRLQNAEPAGVPPDVRILDIAAEHIRKNGVEHMTVLRIAADAGMSHANVYRYYPSKISLIEEITAQWLKPLEAGLHVIGESPDPTFDKLERLIFALHRAYRDKCESDPAIFSLFTEASARGANVARRHYSRRDLEMRRVLEENTVNGSESPDSLDSKRGLSLILDATFRFIDPVAIKANIETPRAALEQRLDLVIKAAFQPLMAREAANEGLQISKYEI